MRTNLQFRSSAFEGGPNAFNPHIDGSKLASFLSDKFRHVGYAGNVVEEDWGWMIELRSDPFDLWVGCASYQDPPDWLAFIEPRKPQIRKLFTKIDTRAEVEKVAEHLERFLLDHGNVTDLRWWSDQESGRN